jgi:hypothetical protein
MNLAIVVPLYEQKVGSRVRYRIRFGAQLADGENIVSATCSIAPSGPTISVVLSGSEVWVYVSGIALGAEYRVTVTPTTDTIPSQVLPYDLDVKGV